VPRRALSILERVLVLSHVVDAESPASMPARTRRDAPWRDHEGGWTTLPDETEPLAEASMRSLTC